MRVTPAFLLLSALVGCAPGGPQDLEADAFVAVVADVEDGALRSFDARTGTDLGTLLVDDDLPRGLLRAPLAPAGLAVHGDHLFLTSFAGGEVLSLDLDSPDDVALVYSDADGGPGLEEPCDLGLSGDTLVVLGNDTRNLLFVDLGPDGSVREIAGEAGPPIRDGHGLTLLDDGLVAVGTSPSVPDLGLVQLWDPATGERVADLAPYGSLRDATDLARSPDGLLTVADWFGNQVLLLDPDSGQVVDQLLGPDQVDRPVALAWTDDGALLVLERHGLVRWSADGGAVRIVDDLLFGRGLVLLPG